MSRSSCAILSLRVGRSFSRISVGKIHLSFSLVLCGSHGFVTASLVYSAADFSGFARGSMVDVLLLHPCFNTFSRGFLAASRRNIQDGDFSLFALCSTAFLIVANGIFSPLCRRFTFAGLTCLRGWGAGHIAVDFSMAIRSVRTWQNPTFKRAANLIKRNIQIGVNLSKPDF